MKIIQNLIKVISVTALYSGHDDPVITKDNTFVFRSAQQQQPMFELAPPPSKDPGIIIGNAECSRNGVHFPLNWGLFKKCDALNILGAAGYDSRILSNLEQRAQTQYVMIVPQNTPISFMKEYGDCKNLVSTNQGLKIKAFVEMVKSYNLEVDTNLLMRFIVLNSPGYETEIITEYTIYLTDPDIKLNHRLICAAAKLLDLSVENLTAILNEELDKNYPMLLFGQIRKKTIKNSQLHKLNSCSPMLQIEDPKTSSTRFYVQVNPKSKEVLDGLVSGKCRLGDWIEVNAYTPEIQEHKAYFKGPWWRYEDLKAALKVTTTKFDISQETITRFMLRIWDTSLSELNAALWEANNIIDPFELLKDKDKPKFIWDFVELNEFGDVSKTMSEMRKLGLDMLYLNPRDFLLKLTELSPIGSDSVKLLFEGIGYLEQRIDEHLVEDTSVKSFHKLLEEIKAKHIMQTAFIILSDIFERYRSDRHVIQEACNMLDDIIFYFNDKLKKTGLRMSIGFKFKDDAGLQKHRVSQDGNFALAYQVWVSIQKWLVQWKKREAGNANDEIRRQIREGLPKLFAHSGEGWDEWAHLIIEKNPELAIPLIILGGHEMCHGWIV